MQALRLVWPALLRVRFLILAAAVAAVGLERYALHANDYLLFEYFGRTVLHKPHFAGGWHDVWRVYPNYPHLQVGPPALFTAVPLQLPPGPQSNQLSAAVMMAALLPCLFMLERIAVREGVPIARLRPVVLIAGLALVPLWADLALTYMHLDDILIFLLVPGAVLAVQRERAVLAAVLLGTAAATKPWAIALAPVLLALPRRQLASAGLGWVLAFVVWWLPFLAADATTFSALGRLDVPVVPGSVWHLLGVHGDQAAKLCNAPGSCLYAAYDWMRPVQFAGSFLLAALAVRRGRWLAAPLVGLVGRIALDPQVWSYYGVGPVLMALLWDLSTGRRLPRWTALVVAAEYAYVLVDDTTVQGVLRLLMTVAVVGWFVVRPPQEPRCSSSTSSIESASAADLSSR